MHRLEVVDDQRMLTTPAFFEIMARWQPRLDARLTDLCTPGERRPFRQRLWAALDLLSALDEGAGPARDQLMQQVLNVLHSEILRPTLRLSSRQLATVTMTLSELDHEATRVPPDVAQFCRRARTVVDIELLA